MDSRRKSAYRPVIRLLLVVAILVITAIVVSLVRTAQRFPDIYKLQWASSILCAYVREHQEWPASWIDLESAYEAQVAINGRPFSLQSISSRVDVDWTYDLDNDKPERRIVWLKGGSEIDVVQANEDLRACLAEAMLDQGATTLRSP